MHTLPQLEAGATLWFTGLPCSGKTTLAWRLGRELEERGHRVEVLDGDELRTSLCRGLGFSRADRHENAVRIGWACEKLSKHGVVAIGAAVSPYRETRTYLRASIPRFVEIYVRAPLAVCIERDVKGMYARAARGELRDFTGIGAPYEEPLAPEILVETDKYGVDACVDHILTSIVQTASWQSRVLAPAG